MPRQQTIYANKIYLVKYLKNLYILKYIMNLLKILYFVLPVSVFSFSRLTSKNNKHDLSSLASSNNNNVPVIRGVTPPLEFFDPLNFSKNETHINYMREAELKHSRIAMVASTLIPFNELFTHKPAIHAFDDLPYQAQITIVAMMFVSEFNSMLKGWKNPYTNPFQLNDNYQPGDIGLSFNTDFTTDDNALLLDKEINNGRLAMVGSIGMIAQELVTGNPLFS
jgi:hypothetical protein